MNISINDLIEIFPGIWKEYSYFGKIDSYEGSPILCHPYSWRDGDLTDHVEAALTKLLGTPFRRELPSQGDGFGILVWPVVDLDYIEVDHWEWLRVQGKTFVIKTELETARENLVEAEAASKRAQENLLFYQNLVKELEK